MREETMRLLLTEYEVGRELRSQEGGWKTAEGYS